MGDTIEETTLPVAPLERINAQEGNQDFAERYRDAVKVSGGTAGDEE